jgi:ribonuclease III
MPDTPSPRAKPRRKRAKPRATGGLPASVLDAVPVVHPDAPATGDSAPLQRGEVVRSPSEGKKKTAEKGSPAAPAPPPSLSPDILASIQTTISHTFKSPALLIQALTHASVTDSRLASNERMEFLGDSVLGLVISERIYQRYPHLLEGEMTKLKSTAVSRQTCAIIARALGLHKHLVLGKGMQNHHELPLSLEAAVLESIIAAIYLDAGYAAAESFIAPLIDPYILRAAADGHQENFKSVLQHHAQQQSLPPPMYRILDEKGPDHAKAFKVGVDLGGRRFTPAWGQTKKKSEQLAALNALQELGLVQTRDDGHLSVVPDTGEVATPASSSRPPLPPSPSSPPPAA